MKPKSRLENGVRVDINTGIPLGQSTERQQKALNANAPITTATLAPQADMKLPPTPTPVVAAGLQGRLESQATQNDTFIQDQKKQTAEREKNASSSLESLLATFDDQEGATAATARAYSKEGGVDELAADLASTNSDLKAEQEALRKQTEAIQRNPGTATAAERDREVSEATRVSLRKQADIAIVQLAKQGKYDSAREIADRAVAAQLEGQKQELDLRKFIYEENKDLFTKSEQQLFETQQQERQNAYDMEAFKLKSDYEQKIRQSDPLYRANLRAQELANQKLVAELDAVEDPQEQLRNNATLTLAKELRADDAAGKGSALGASAAKLVPFGVSLGLQGNRAAFDARVATLKSNLTLENLSLLKGPMSDKDILFLMAIGSSLNSDMSEDEFNVELDKVIDRMESAGATAAPSEGQQKTYSGVTYVVRNGVWEPK